MLIWARTIQRWYDKRERRRMERLTCQEGEEMPIRSKINFTRRQLLAMLAVLILVSCGFARRAIAQESGAHDRIYVVTHVDIIPPEAAAGTKLVQQYVTDTRKDPGVVRVEASSEISRGNHISIVEVWQNQKAFDDHVAAAHTRQFRQQLDPKLGSPYDERLHYSLE
jgi:quinol monooxygenase YgiN